jgi:alpha-D-xyloside xylohydrolase
MRRTLPLSWLVVTMTLCVSFRHAAAATPQKVEDGVIVALGSDTLKIEVCTDDVIRVAYAREPAFFRRPSVVTAPRRCGGATWDVAMTGQTAALTTARLSVRVDLTTGAVSFFDQAGAPILAEATRTLTPAETQGERAYQVRQEWQANAGESQYGLGQHQLGLMDIKGYDLDLWQHNATVAVPVLVSSRGYGLLWDNLSFSRFGDLRQAEPLPRAVLRDATGTSGGLTGTYFAGAHFDREVATRVDATIAIEVPGGTPQPNTHIHPALPPEGDVSVRWEGAIVPTATGDYTFQTYTNSGFKMWLDGRLVIDHWRQGWLPWRDVARASLVEGRSYRVKIEWSKDQGIETCQVRWKTPAPSSNTSLWSEVGDGIDYYFFYGPQIDKVIAGYRRVTGEAPMMPRWAFGFWQSRERYKTQQESLDVLDGFRSRHIPIDVIVQDWQYWKLDSWGSHEFEASRFPDPDGWIREIHDKYHARLMISVWGKYYPGTANFEAMHNAGYLFDAPLARKLKDWLGFPYTFFDPFGAAARRTFWDQVNKALFRKGVDAWWMDATEPDLEQPMPTLDGQRSLAHPTAAGTGARVLNGYALATSRALFDGQRATAPDQRVFILTRSAFAGQQRYAAATWSGDITSTWTALRQQIPAGLSFSLSGLPYWTTDTGGFAVPPRFAKSPQSPEDEDEWKELNVRWFQYSTFCPLLRAHGQSPNREMWFLGGESDPAYRTELKFDRLRYRMLPYIYSLAGAVTHEAGSLLRPFVMDFANDARALQIGDEFMFGPAFLVAPVTTYKARQRTVYLPSLPEGATWYDFWSGEAVAGGQTVDASAPYDALPVYVRAGSIVPFGPDLQYTDERPADPITLYVYAGADGHFTLYDDDGVSYAYERDEFSRIPISWHERTGTLTIGARQGSFPGMRRERTFNVIVVSNTGPIAYGEPVTSRTVSYRGDPIDLATERGTRP